MEHESSRGELWAAWTTGGRTYDARAVPGGQDVGCNLAFVEAATCDVLAGNRAGLPLAVCIDPSEPPFVLSGGTPAPLDSDSGLGVGGGAAHRLREAILRDLRVGEANRIAGADTDGCGIRSEAGRGKERPRFLLGDARDAAGDGGGAARARAGRVGAAEWAEGAGDGFGIGGCGIARVNGDLRISSLAFDGDCVTSGRWIDGHAAASALALRRILSEPRTPNHLTHCRG